VQADEPLSEITPRVLIYAPLGEDAKALAEEAETLGLATRCLSDHTEFSSVIEAGDNENFLFVVISQEGATLSAGKSLCDLHIAEPVWARLPVLFLVSKANRLPPACQVLADCDAAPSFIYFERPARRPVLRQTFRALSESRQRQFRTRDLMQSLKEEKEHNVFLLREMRHRVGNSLAVLQSLFRMTVRKADSLDELDESFGARLRSMSDAHARLTDSYDQPVNLAGILEEHVRPYSNESSQLRLDGDAVMLSEKVAFDLAMTIHELATNAAKYGALSTPSGQIEITWLRDMPSGTLDITWRESGGPPVEPPKRKGIGSSLIESFSSHDADPPSIEFNRNGLVWRAKISSKEIR